MIKSNNNDDQLSGFITHSEQGTDGNSYELQRISTKIGARGAKFWVSYTLGMSNQD